MKFSTMVSHRLLDRLIHEVQLSLEIRAGFSVRSNTVVKLKVVVVANALDYTQAESHVAVVSRSLPRRRSFLLTSILM